MKKVKYKKEFKSLDEALNRVPNELKEDNNTFIMTDGNKDITVRWEGTLEEGVAIPLVENDKTLVNEDMSKMKKLMGYKSQDTIGTPSAKSRVDESNQFKTLLSNVKGDNKK